MLRIFTSRNDTYQWAQSTQHGGAVYALVFDSYIKVGSSHNWKYRFYELLRLHNQRPFVCALIGAQTASYRVLEKSFHAAMRPLLLSTSPFSHFSRPREYYHRSPALQLSVHGWLESDYSAEAYAELIQLSHEAEQAREESYLPRRTRSAATA